MYCQAFLCIKLCIPSPWLQYICDIALTVICTWICRSHTVCMQVWYLFLHRDRCNCYRKHFSYGTFQQSYTVQYVIQWECTTCVQCPCIAENSGFIKLHAWGHFVFTSMARHCTCCCASHSDHSPFYSQLEVKQLGSIFRFWLTVQGYWKTSIYIVLYLHCMYYISTAWRKELELLLFSQYSNVKDACYVVHWVL